MPVVPVVVVAVLEPVVAEPEHWDWHPVPQYADVAPQYQCHVKETVTNELTLFMIPVLWTTLATSTKLGFTAGYRIY